jgi:hypothetical protein
LAGLKKAANKGEVLHKLSLVEHTPLLSTCMTMPPIMQTPNRAKKTFFVRASNLAWHGE